MAAFLKGVLLFTLGTWFGVGIMAVMKAASDEDDRMEGTEHGSM